MSFLAEEARDLAKIAREHPEVVGTRGTVTRAFGTAKELITGTAPEGQEMQERFKSRLETLQSRLSKQILGSRYFSAPVQQRMETLLPAGKRFTAPTEAIQAFEEIARQLDQSAKAAGAQLRPPGGGGTSDDDILKGLGLK
jgi:hypothetical protein